MIPKQTKDRVIFLTSVQRQVDKPAIPEKTVALHSHQNHFLPKTTSCFFFVKDTIHDHEVLEIVEHFVFSA